MPDAIMPLPPALVQGWYRHQDSQGKRSHAGRTLPGNDTHYITLCGQVWLREGIQQMVLADTRDFIRERFPCQRCVKALARWEAK